MAEITFGDWQEPRLTFEFRAAYDICKDLESGQFVKLPYAGQDVLCTVRVEHPSLIEQLTQNGPLISKLVAFSWPFFPAP